MLPRLQDVVIGYVYSPPAQGLNRVLIIFFHGKEEKPIISVYSKVFEIHVGIFGAEIVSWDPLVYLGP